MSGQQIGTVVGGVIGMFFGMPQLGAFIGGVIGGAIDPDVIKGPHIGDGQNQSSNEGVPIPWILGTAGWVQGNIVQKSPRREIKKEDDGKGGPVVVTYEAHQDFCIMVCESSETRDSLMTGALIIRVNGKIVYDMRPDKNFGAENDKFLRNHRLYNGNEAQLPDPTMEAIVGVERSLAYRGVFTLVGVDINLSPYGDAIPTYEFVMAGAGEQVTTDLEYLTGPMYGRFSNDHFPLLDPEPYYTFTGSRRPSIAGSPVTFSADTIEEIIAHFNAIGQNGFPSNLQYYQGYSSANGDFTGNFTIDMAEDQEDVTNNTSVILCYNEEQAAEWYNVDPTTACAFLPYTSPGEPQWYGFGGGEMLRIHLGTLTPDPRYVNYNNCTSYPPEPPGANYPRLEGILPLYILCKSATVPQVAESGDPCALGAPVLLPDVPGWVIDCDGNVTPEPTYVIESGNYHALQAETTSSIGSRNIFITRMLAPVLDVGDPDDTEAFWEAAYDAAVLAGTMPPGAVYGVDYPENVLEAYRATASITTLSPDGIGADTAITRICVRGGLTAGDIDVSEMGELIMGYPIMQPYDGAECLRPIMSGLLAYGSECDAQLHFHHHGEDIEIVIDPDDLIENDRTEEEMREQAVEYPRLISVTSIDPTQDYTARPQSDRRTSPDVRAIGEQSMQIPLVIQPDRQRQLAAIAMKVAWARAQGTREFSVPYAQYDVYLKLVAGKPLALESKRYMAANIRLEDGDIHIRGAYDRQSAYTSDVTATPAPPPTPPPSTISGVTIAAFMNIPVLRDQDDRVGIYIAVGGLLPSWSGCLLQMSVDDGASWETVIPSMTEASILGYLTAPLALAPPDGDDVTNTLSVAVNGGELNSITRTQYLNEGNPCAIVKTDGTAELMQFEIATETSGGEYELTTLGRGGLGSVASAHSTGARFTMLSSVYFLELASGLIGRTLLFRPVSFGTSPESNATYSLTFNPAVSQTELAPVYPVASRNGSDDFTVTVVPRHRLGNDLTPIASANFTGYSWRFEVSGIVSAMTTDPTTPTVTLTAAQQTAIWGSPQPSIDVRVSLTNRITGAGPALEATL